MECVSTRSQLDRNKDCVVFPRQTLNSANIPVTVYSTSPEVRLHMSTVTCYLREPARVMTSPPALCTRGWLAEPTSGVLELVMSCLAHSAAPTLPREPVSSLNTPFPKRELTHPRAGVSQRDMQLIPVPWKKEATNTRSGLKNAKLQ